MVCVLIIRSSRCPRIQDCPMDRFGPSDRQKQPQKQKRNTGTTRHKTQFPEISNTATQCNGIMHELRAACHLGFSRCREGRKLGNHCHNLIIHSRERGFIMREVKRSRLAGAIDPLRSLNVLSEVAIYHLMMEQGSRLLA
jgi:hypothetical protein